MIIMLEREGEDGKMRKNLLWASLIIPLILCVFIVKMNVSIPIESSSIAVVPENVLDETLTPGENFTISIYTDYDNKSDVWGYELALSYNPNVLHGGVNKTETWIMDGATMWFNTTYTPVIENSEYVYLDGILQNRSEDYYVWSYPEGEMFFWPSLPGNGANVTAIYLYGIVNGDLITTDKHSSARFEAGYFDDTLGRSVFTKAWFHYSTPPPYVTSGPGILANVTFTVVGYGTSNITILAVPIDTQLKKPDGPIISADLHPDQIGHGYFRNLIAGDANGDGVVDIFDIGSISAHWYPSSPVGPLGYGREADINLDGAVDTVDIDIASANWGRTV